MNATAPAPTLQFGVLVRLEAAPERDEDIAALLQATAALAREEAGTLAWYGLRFGRGEYAIFDAFADESARDAHLQGPVARALRAAGDALASPPVIETIRILAHKTPMTREAVTKGLLLSFPARDGRADDVEQVLRELLPVVADEPRTIAWFAIQRDNGDYGIFDVFADNGGRFSHLSGQVPRDLARHSLALFGGVPEVHLLDVLAELAVTVGAATDQAHAAGAAALLDPDPVVPGAPGLSALAG